MEKKPLFGEIKVSNKEVRVKVFIRSCLVFLSLSISVQALESPPSLVHPHPVKPPKPTPTRPVEFNVPDCLSFPESFVPGVYIVSMNRARMDSKLVASLMSRLTAMPYLATTKYPQYAGEWVHITLFSPFVSTMPAAVLLWHIKDNLSFLETGPSLMIQCMAQPESVRL